MTQMQGHLTEEAHEALAVIAARTGRTQSELIRDAVDGFIIMYGEGTGWSSSAPRVVCGMTATTCPISRYCVYGVSPDNNELEVLQVCE